MEAHYSTETAASPEAAWSTIGGFCGIASWHPAVAACEQSTKDGATYRTLTLGDGAKLVEKLIERDDRARSYTYSIEEGPLPVAGYRSTIKVVPSGNGSVLDWAGTFEAKGVSGSEAVKIVTGIYKAGLDALAEKLSK
jgi:Polyketide cyclase / dehydrase and lipid transport